MTINRLGSGMGPYDVAALNRGNAAQDVQSQESARTQDTQQSEGDKVSLSEAGRLFASGMQTAQNTSDVRADKVAELKSQVQAGTYGPDSKTIASNMIQEDFEAWG